MKILLDECVPKDLAKLIEGHEVLTVSQCAWTGIKNGKLLALAGSQFDVFVTIDKNLSFQQNLDNLPIAILVLHCITNKLSHVALHIPVLTEILGCELKKIVYDLKLEK